MLRARIALLVAPLVLATSFTAVGQNRDNFYNGVRDGEHGGSYGRGHDHGQYNRDRRYRDDRDRGGVGPGKGALIGAGGGALVGGLLGGGLKGALIGSAAGAGIGAIAGKAHQDNRRRDYYGR